VLASRRIRSGDSWFAGLVEEPQFGLGCGHRGQARLARCAADAIVDESIVGEGEVRSAGYLGRKAVGSKGCEREGQMPAIEVVQP
jgi:hypothetical protein